MIFLPKTVLFFAYTWATQAIADAKCPVTFVNGFAYECGMRGSVQDPSPLKNYRSVNSTETCAAACLKDETCKSFRYRHKQQVCNLYTKRLGGMSYTTNAIQAGKYYDRSCYSNDCSTIDSCTARNDCGDSEFYNYYSYCGYTYRYFACGYGLTAKIPTEPRVSVLDEGLNACNAIRACGQGGSYGPFNIFFHIPSQRWVCAKYAGINGYSYYYYPHDEYVVPTTLSVVNGSVGESYMYWLSSHSYGGPC